MSDSTTTARTIRDWIDLYPGKREELAARLGITRMGLYHLEKHRHKRCPFLLLKELARALTRPADGSTAPTQKDLIAAWNAEGSNR